MFVLCLQFNLFKDFIYFRERAPKHDLGGCRERGEADFLLSQEPDAGLHVPGPWNPDPELKADA